MDAHLIGIFIQTLIFLGGFYGMVLRNDFQGKGLKEDMRNLREEMKKLADVIIVQAVQTREIQHLQTQLDIVQQNVEDMRRGHGFIHGRGGVDREYP
jgi:Leu/Phe-tRNA-protein transferase